MGEGTERGSVSEALAAALTPVAAVPDEVEPEVEVDVTACLMGTCACDAPDDEGPGESALFWDELVEQLGDPRAETVETDYETLRQQALEAVSK